MASNENADSVLATGVNYSKISKVYECPVCYSLCRPPIYTCLSGHLVCRDCLTQINDICPTCRGSLSNKRNVALEQIAEVLHYPCKFTEGRCNVVAQLGELEKHERHCNFRTCLCPYSDYFCRWEGEMKELLSHMHVGIIHPPGIIGQDRKFTIMITQFLSPPPKMWIMGIQYYNKFFLINILYTRTYAITFPG